MAGKTVREKGPNILVVGTPGTGKTTLCAKVLKSVTYGHLNVAQLIEDKKLYSHWDDEFQCSLFDPRLVKQELEAADLKSGGYLIEFHALDVFAPNNIDHVLVLTCDLKVLGRRLDDRGYPANKVSENMQCEIFEIFYYDAAEYFGKDKVVTFRNNDLEDQQKIIEHIQGIIKTRKWRNKLF